MRTCIAILLLILPALVSAPRTAGENWPQWRGPARTGVLPAADAPAAWPAELKKGWSTEIGEGYSSPIVGNGRVYVHARRDPDEVVSAIDLATGKIVWQQKYASPFTKNPYAKEMAKGPYSTPLFSDGRLFTLGTSGILSAWNAATGELVWRKDYSSRVDTSKLFCGTAMSPLRTRHGIVVQIGDDRGGTMITFDPATGKEVWTRDMRGPGYASPIEVTLQGVAQLVAMTTRSVVGVSADSGTLLWEFPFDDEWNENIVTPIAYGAGVIVSGVRQGTRALSPERAGNEWKVEQTWHTPDVTMYMGSPVLAGGVLFGHSSKRRGQFVAVDPADGRIRWATEGRDGVSASVVAAGNHLVFLTTESQLIVAALDGQAFREVRRYALGERSTYAHPAVLRDRVIARDATHVTAWMLE
ncbi:MAG TPA: PQQ-binding-like beta-propeller repeat protein [Vicinamibacterales bacterium]|nr:PQQ-binding-like beta-propeller repeat protein [Vicinamibacterales bacterium]